MTGRTPSRKDIRTAACPSRVTSPRRGAVLLKTSRQLTISHLNRPDALYPQHPHRQQGQFPPFRPLDRGRSYPLYGVTGLAKLTQFVELVVVYMRRGEESTACHAGGMGGDVRSSRGSAPSRYRYPGSLLQMRVQTARRLRRVGRFRRLSSPSYILQLGPKP